jgi:hypothetical protein
MAWEKLDSSTDLGLNNRQKKWFEKDYGDSLFKVLSKSLDKYTIEIIDQIKENNLKIESNAELNWEKWKIIQIDLEDEWKKIKMFLPDNLKSLHIMENVQELKRFIREKWIKISLEKFLTHLLRDVTPHNRCVKEYEWINDDDYVSKWKRIYPAGVEPKYRDDPAKLGLIA